MGKLLWTNMLAEATVVGVVGGLTTGFFMMLIETFEVRLSRAVGAAVVGFAVFYGLAFAGAAEGLDVIIEAGGAESLYRHVSATEWRETVNGAADFSWVADEVAAFDVRPGGAPWFSTHNVGRVDLVKWRIAVGEREGASQWFVNPYGERYALAVIPVPEPPAIWLVTCGLAVTSAFCFYKWRKGANFGSETKTSGRHGEDAGAVARGVENAYLGSRRQRVDELRQRGGDPSCGR
jgi:hypothetical protein